MPIPVASMTVRIGIASHGLIWNDTCPKLFGVFSLEHANEGGARHLQIPDYRADSMATDYMFIGVGALVWFFGIGMISWHVYRRRLYLNDAGIHPAELKFLEQQYRRRMQTSALTITLGALISMCDYLPQFKSSPGFAAAYVMGLLLISMWLVLLALGDAVASRVHMSQSLRKNRLTRQALQDAIDELRQKQAEAVRLADERTMIMPRD